MAESAAPPRGAAEAACPGGHRRPRPGDTQRAAALDATHGHGCVADVRDRASLDEAVEETLDRFGRLDVVIANAGLLAKAATMRNTAIADIEATLAVNVTGVANTVAAGLEPVIASKGQIVLISSVFAFINGMGTIPYAMSKAAVEQPGAGCASSRRPRRLGPHGVLLAGADRHDRPRCRRGSGGDELLARCRSPCSGGSVQRSPPPPSRTVSGPGPAASSAPACGVLSRPCADCSVLP